MVRNKLFKLLYTLGLHYIFHQFVWKNNKVILLCFHRVSDKDDIMFPPLKLIVFEQLLDYIKKNFTVLHLHDLEYYKKSDKPALIITFDDGYKDFIENALTVLVKRNFPAVHNVVVNSVETGEPIWTESLNNIINKLFKRKQYVQICFNQKIYKILPNKKETFKNGINLYNELLNTGINERNNFINYLKSKYDIDESLVELMDWIDVIECSNNNIKIGSHTYFHNSLPAIKNQKSLQLEIYKSKLILEEKLKTKIDTIAYPNGQYNEDIIKLSVKAGYKYLLTTNEAFWDLATNRFKSMLFPRISINHNNCYENIFKIYNFHNIVKLYKIH